MQQNLVRYPQRDVAFQVRTDLLQQVRYTLPEKLPAAAQDARDPLRQHRYNHAHQQHDNRNPH
jgi:hypothetical protein